MEHFYVWVEEPWLNNEKIHQFWLNECLFLGQIDKLPVEVVRTTSVQWKNVDVEACSWTWWQSHSKHTWRFLGLFLPQIPNLTLWWPFFQHHSLWVSEPAVSNVYITSIEKSSGEMEKTKRNKDTSLKHWSTHGMLERLQLKPIPPISQHSATKKTSKRQLCPSNKPYAPMKCENVFCQNSYSCLPESVIHLDATDQKMCWGLLETLGNLRENTTMS